MDPSALKQDVQVY